MDMKCGFFTAANAKAANIIVGFVPDVLEIRNLTAQVPYFWSKAVAEGGGVGLHGTIGTTVSTGTSGTFLSTCPDEDNGISALNTSGDYANVESPIPGRGKKAVEVHNWVADSIIDGTAMASRTAVAIGTLMRPVSRNGFIYECISASGDSKTSATMPTLPTTPGVSVVDDKVDWICRNEEIVRGGGQGFIFGSGCNVDSEVIHFTAYRTDKDNYLGDAQEGDLSII